MVNMCILGLIISRVCNPTMTNMWNMCPSGVDDFFSFLVIMCFNHHIRITQLGLRYGSTKMISFLRIQIMESRPISSIVVKKHVFYVQSTFQNTLKYSTHILHFRTVVFYNLTYPMYSTYLQVFIISRNNIFFIIFLKKKTLKFYEVFNVFYKYSKYLTYFI